MPFYDFDISFLAHILVPSNSKSNTISSLSKYETGNTANGSINIALPTFLINDFHIEFGTFAMSLYGPSSLFA
jgi:hypothetical protein